MEAKDTVINGADWEVVNKKAGVDVLDIVVNLDNRYTITQQAELIVERCNLTAKIQAEISFKAGQEEEYKKWVKAFLKVGYVKLSDNQELPKNPHTLVGSRDNYAHAQQDMLKSNFRRVDAS